jgi:hypothetical protein
VICANVSGVPVSIRVAAFEFSGFKKADVTINNVGNAAVRTFSTHSTVLYSEDVVLHTGSLSQGVINVEATNAAVFCTATMESASLDYPEAVDLHVVRVNPDPGTVE